MLVCAHCGEEVHFSRFLDDWYCGDCRVSDVVEIEDPEE